MAKDTETLDYVYELMAHVSKYSDSTAQMLPGFTQLGSFSKAVLLTNKELKVTSTPKVGVKSAVAISNPRTALLLFDQVFAYGPETADINGLISYGATKAEAQARLTFKLLGVSDNPNFSSVFGITQDSLIRALDEYWLKKLDLNIVECPIGFLFNKLIAKELSEKYSAEFVPIYDSINTYDQLYRRGDVSSFLFTMQEVEVVSEEDLTWEQVKEFRKDEEALKKFRNLIYWFNKNFTDYSIDQIKYQLEEDLANYKWALKKHGLITFSGTLRSIIKSDTLIGTGFAASVADYIANTPSLTLLAGTGVMLASVYINVTEKLIEREDLIKAHKEIAFITDLSKKFN